MQHPRVLVVIPCRNEEATLRATLDSLLAQSVRPTRILVVNDGSTDGTSSILQGYVERFPETVRVVNRDGHGARDTGKGIAAVVNYGLAREALTSYDFICKFDADLEFPSDYLQLVCTTLEANDGLGLAGGICLVNEGDGAWVPEVKAKLDHVRGALKTYRRAAFTKIGGIVEATGWDTIDEHMLRYHGYGVSVLQGLRVKQYRPTNAATDRMKMADKIGRSLFNMRADPLVASISIAKRWSVLGGDMPLLPLVLGFVKPKWRGEKPPIDHLLGRSINAYRRRGFYQALGYRARSPGDGK